MFAAIAGNFGVVPISAYKALVTVVKFLAEWMVILVPVKDCWRTGRRACVDVIRRRRGRRICVC